MEITKAKLIEMLADFPDDTIILLDGYEKGFDAVHEIKEITARFLPNAFDWDGEYAEESEYQAEKDGESWLGDSEYVNASEQTVKAIYIKGRRGDKLRGKEDDPGLDNRRHHLNM